MIILYRAVVLCKRSEQREGIFVVARSSCNEIKKKRECLLPMKSNIKEDEPNIYGIAKAFIALESVRRRSQKFINKI